jgi:NADH:ubiquinone oxidoreductase subunit 3 (subunit A)
MKNSVMDKMIVDLDMLFILPWKIGFKARYIAPM